MKGSIQSDITKLRQESQALIHRMLDQEVEIDEIRRAVYRLSGERVSLHALGYYAAHYARRSQDRREVRTQTDDFIRLDGKHGVKVSELLRAVLIENLIVARRKKQFTKADLFKLDDAERKRREFELKQKQARQSARREKKALELKERQAQLTEQRFQLDREKAQATLDQLERKANAGKSLSVEDVRRIREIYGLYDEPQPQDDDRDTETSDGNNE